MDSSSLRDLATKRFYICCTRRLTSNFIKESHVQEKPCELPCMF